MEIYRASKYIEVTNVKLDTYKYFFESFCVQCLMIYPILNIYQCTCGYPQRNFNKFWSWSMAWIASTIDLIFLSSTPFCLRLEGTIVYFCIPSFLQNTINSFEMYSIIVRTKYLNLLPSFIFTQSLEIIEKIDGLILLLQVIYLSLPSNY